IVDREGKELVAEIHLPEVDTIDDVVHARDGAFPVCSTTEFAESLVLYLGAREIRRVRLALRPGEITILRP
ncbi:MAG TPA: hypothetical protein VM509_03040, partial [Planctomycetota bacterium]|nr:hypothetical protein [Planctomycetota bacterium]